MQTLIARKYAFVIPATGYDEKRGYQVGIAVEGERGYNVTDWYWGHDYKVACELADERNAKMGLTKEQAEDIIISTMRA